MSAYIVSDNQVIFLAIEYIKAVRNNRGSFNDSDVEEIANILLTENYKSVNFRYNESGIEKVEKRFLNLANYQQLHDKYNDPVTIIKLCQNLDYQSCEHDQWKDSQACKILQTIIDNCIRKLPGYDEAPWGM